MGDKTEIVAEEDAVVEEEKKKGGFFRKIFKITAVLAAIGTALMFWKRRQGSDIDDVEWQELPPPAGG